MGAGASAGLNAAVKSSSDSDLRAALQDLPEDAKARLLAALGAEASGVGNPVVLTFHYTYKEGKQAEVDAILSQTIAWYKEKGEFRADCLRHFGFEHVEGGYTACEVFASGAAYEVHAKNTLEAPFMADGTVMKLAEMIEEKEAVIIGEAAEVAKGPSIAEFYPKEGSAKYVNEKPDTAKFTKNFGGMRHGWAGGAIVLTFAYEYKEGKKAEVDAILNTIEEYYKAKGEFGDHCMMSYRFDAIGETGYKAVEFFKDAEAYEVHAKNTLEAPFMADGTVMKLAEMIEEKEAVIYGEPGEVAASPSIAAFYPHAKYVDGKPDLSKFPDTHFGWK